MNKPSMLAAIALLISLTGLPGCASKPSVSAPQVGRFRIVSIGSAEGKAIALLDSETGCMWEYHPSDRFSPTEYFGDVLFDALPVGKYPDIISAAGNKDKNDKGLDALPLKNLREQSDDCDAVRYRAVQDAIGKKPSR